MCGISFVIFLIAAIVFIVIMARDPRTLWSGFSLFWMLVCFALFSFFVLSQYADQLAEHDWLMGVLVFLFIAAVLCACAFPGLIDNYIQMVSSPASCHTCFSARCWSLRFSLREKPLGASAVWLGTDGKCPFCPMMRRRSLAGIFVKVHPAATGSAEAWKGRIKTFPLPGPCRYSKATTME